MHHVNINEDLAMSVDTETTSFTLTYPRTAMMNGEQYSDLSPELQQHCLEEVMKSQINSLVMEKLSQTGRENLLTVVI